jgi:KUP system potassium uptake protein
MILLPWLIFACLDGTFLSSALIKVPDGAWFTILLASALAATFILWRFGKEQQWKAEASDRHSLAKFVDKDEDGSLRLAGRNGGESLTITRGLGIFFDKGGIKTPLVFSQFISKLVSTPQVMVFFHMRALEYPTVPPDERFVVSKIRYLPNCYRIVVRYGFMDEVVTRDLASVIFRHLREFVIRENLPGAVEKSPSTPEPTHGAPRNQSTDAETWSNPEKTIIKPETEESIDLAELQKAYDHRVLYIIGKEEMMVKPGTLIWRMVLLRTFLFLREYSRTKMSNLKVPTDQLVEIGFIKEV